MPSKKEIEEAEEKAGMYLLTEDELLVAPSPNNGTDTPYVDTWGLIQKPQMLCTTAISLLDMMTKLHMTGQFKDEVEQCRILAMRNLELATKAFDEYEAKVG